MLKEKKGRRRWENSKPAGLVLAFSRFASVDALMSQNLRPFI